MLELSNLFYIYDPKEYVYTKSLFGNAVIYEKILKTIIWIVVFHE